jgi:hypothetical protein
MQFHPQPQARRNRSDAFPHVHVGIDDKHH